MKKKIGLLVALIMTCVLTGCLGMMGPRETVEEFLNRYIKNDKAIMEELDTYLDKQDLTTEQKDRYRKIIKKEYSSLKYDIKKENIADDKATVDVEITVRDLYGASKTAENELLTNPTNFYTNGLYSKEKFIDYKLGIMESTEEVITYNITFNLEKSNGKWSIDDLDDETLEKIHGIYDSNK